MLIKTKKDWNSVFEKLKENQDVEIIADGFPVQLKIVANFSLWKLSIKPLLNDQYFPDFINPIFSCQNYPAGLGEILERFYYRINVLTKIGKKNKKHNRQGSFDFIYTYGNFPSFRILAAHYRKNFEEILLVEENDKSLYIPKYIPLAGCVANALEEAKKPLTFATLHKHLMKALKPGEL